MKLGRPSGFKPKYTQALIDYFSIPPYREVMKTVVSNGLKFEVPTLEASDMPTLAGFAISIGVHRETLLNWAKDDEDFFDAYKKAKDFQENFIAVNGNKGLINTAFGIFTAKNVLGWRDKQPDEAPETLVRNEIKVTTDQLKELVKGAREIKK